MRSKGKRKNAKTQNGLESFEIWFRSVPDKDRKFDFNEPDYTIMAKSHFFAAKSAACLAGKLYVKAFKGIEVPVEEAIYVVRPTMLKSSRFLTFWK